MNPGFINNPRQHDSAIAPNNESVNVVRNDQTFERTASAASMQKSLEIFLEKNYLINNKPGKLVGVVDVINGKMVDTNLVASKLTIAHPMIRDMIINRLSVNIEVSISEVIELNGDIPIILDHDLFDYFIGVFNKHNNISNQSGQETEGAYKMLDAMGLKRRIVLEFKSVGVNEEVYINILVVKLSVETLQILRCLSTHKSIQINGENKSRYNE